MKKLIVVLSLISLWSCSVSKPGGDLPADPLSDLDNPSAEVIEEVISIQPVYHASRTILTDLVHTKLELTPIWEKSQMKGIATLTARPHFYPNSELTLDAKGMEIYSVTMNGQSSPFTYQNDTLRITLDKSYKRNEKYTVIIDYLAKPEERSTKGSAAITSDKGLYFINPTGSEPDKMTQLWTQGETESSSVWFPTIDAPNSKTSQEIFITVDDKYVTLSNGKLISQKKLENGMRIDYWKQDLPHAPYLFMLAVGEFKVVKDEFKKSDGTSIPVHYYVEPEWESSARAIFGETPAMIRYFSDLMGVEYPWDKYHQIVVRDYVSGAMENTGAVIFGDFLYKNERELLDGNEHSIIAHELFHHWFGDLVTCESWSNLPLNESFANYSQYLWDEHRYGKDEADYQAESEASGYFQSAGMQGHHPLIWFEYSDKEEMFDGHSYNKGGRILHMLRAFLGDDAFFAGMNRYLTQNQYQAAEYHHLRLAFEEVSGRDLNWFFNQWFLGEGHPVLDIQNQLNTVEKTITLHIRQTQDLDSQPLFQLPVDVALFDASGKTLHRIWIDESEETFTLPYSDTLYHYVFDASQVLLGNKVETKSQEMYLSQYRKDEPYLVRKEAFLEGTKMGNASAQDLILKGLEDSFWHIRLLAIGKCLKLKDEQKQTGLIHLRQLVADDPNSSVRMAALNMLEKMLDDTEIINLSSERIEKDRSYQVVSTALKVLAKRDVAKAMNLAASLEKENSSSMLSGVAQLYASYAGEEKMQFLSETILGNTVQGFEKLSLVNSFTFYLVRHDLKLLSAGLPVYEKLGKSGNFYMSMFLPQNVNYIINHLNNLNQAATDKLKEEERVKDEEAAAKTRLELLEIQLLQVDYNKLLSGLQKPESEH